MKVPKSRLLLSFYKISYTKNLAQYLPHSITTSVNVVTISLTVITWGERKGAHVRFENDQNY